MIERFRNVIFGGVILAIGAGIVVLLTYRPAPVSITINPPPPTATPAPSNTPGPVTVYVSGDVVNAPATYTLPPGSRVLDALNAAGGVNSDANLIDVNLAQVLHDGDQINVPAIDPNAKPTRVKPAATATQSGPVYVNSATAQELQRLPGIGPSLAQKIIDYRTKNGPFKTMDDLRKVSGIGPARISEWDGLIDFSTGN